MQATVQKWGNSNAIRIPKVILNTFDIKENDKVEITVTDNGFTVQKKSEHVSLAERLEKFYDKPVEKIKKVTSEKIDWGEPMGEEIW